MSSMTSGKYALFVLSQEHFRASLISMPLNILRTFNVTTTCETAFVEVMTLNAQSKTIAKHTQFFDEVLDNIFSIVPNVVSISIVVACINVIVVSSFN